MNFLQGSTATKSGKVPLLGLLENGNPLEKSKNDSLFLFFFWGGGAPNLETPLRSSFDFANPSIGCHLLFGRLISSGQQLCELQEKIYQQEMGEGPAQSLPFLLDFTGASKGPCPIFQAFFGKACQEERGFVALPLAGEAAPTDGSRLKPEIQMASSGVVLVLKHLHEEWTFQEDRGAILRTCFLLCFFGCCFPFLIKGNKTQLRFCEHVLHCREPIGLETRGGTLSFSTTQTVHVQ